MVQNEIMKKDLGMWCKSYEKVTVLECMMFLIIVHLLLLRIVKCQ